MLTQEIAGRLVTKRHHRITLFMADFPSGLTVKNVDGVYIIREGCRYRVYTIGQRHIIKETRTIMILSSTKLM